LVLEVKLLSCCVEQFAVGAQEHFTDTDSWTLQRVSVPLESTNNSTEATALVIVIIYAELVYVTPY